MLVWKLFSQSLMSLYVGLLFLPFCFGLISNGIHNDEKLVVLGLGRTGSVVVSLAQEQNVFGGGIVGTTTKYQPRPDGITRVSRPSGLSREHLADATHVLCTIPFNGDPLLLKEYTRVAETVPNKSWVGVLSTTGVYGDHEGGWVTEESECRAATASTQRYLDLEEFWEQIARKHGHTCRIFRCAGIYGKTRSALHTTWKQGFRRPEVARQPEVRTNRIHELDIARAILASMKQDSPFDFRIYNLADDEPEMRSVVMDYASSLIRKNVSIPPDPKEPRGRAFESENTRISRRGRDSKQVSNARMKQELLPREGLLYPTYREGFADVLEHNKERWKIESWTRVQGG